MKLEVFWRGVAILFGITTILLTAISLFLTFRNNPSKPSEIEKYLKLENDLLKKQQDSLYSLINKQNLRLVEKDKILSNLSNQKKQIQIVYYGKYQKIDGYSVRQLTNEFDSIFSKVRVD